MRRLAPFVLLLACSPWEAAAAGGADDSDRPFNLSAIINCNDLGHADLGCYGRRRIRTPAPRPASPAAGARFTTFYPAQPVCSASRAALPSPAATRTAWRSSAPWGRRTRGAGSTRTRSRSPELLKSRGYATAAYGKWHLGNDPSSCPCARASTTTSASPTRTTCGRSIPRARGLPAAPPHRPRVRRSR